MYPDNIFKNVKPNKNIDKQNYIDLNNNAQSIFYKYIPRDPQKIQSKNSNSPSSHQPLSHLLAKDTLSPNHTQAKINFAPYRSKSNILYQFQKYIVYNKVLGEGSFSKVYLGELKKSKKLVAIKQVDKLESNEIACLMNSQSPYIIKLYQFWTLKNQSYIALELCDGNLRQILDKISVEEKISIFEQIVEGMDYLNKKNIIHRDLKFQNILIKNNAIKISDFGFAKPIGAKLAVFSEKCGTPYTMAPQIYFFNGQGKPVYSHKCDIYSLGVILHEMLYNKHPFDYSIEKMRNNDRVNINKKFGMLDVLIERSLQQQVSKRCNWSQFIKIFSLFKTKKNQEALQILRQTNRNIPQNYHYQTKIKKTQPYNNLVRYKKNNQEGFPKQQTRKDPRFEQNFGNPFENINIPSNQNKLKKVEQRKPNFSKEEGEKIKSNRVQKKLQNQQWKKDHDQYFKLNKQDDQEHVISCWKLVFVLIIGITVLFLIHNGFKVEKS